MGTIKRNKRILAKAFQEKKHIPLGESKFLFKHETTLVSFQSKKEKNVLLLSTMHNKAEVGDNGKPDIVLTYNKTKGGVDAMDQMTHAFTTKRKSKRWPMVYFFILDFASIAARVVFKSKFPADTLSHEKNRQRFNSTVARSLVVAQIERHATFPSHYEIIRQNIACVLKSLCPEPQPAPQQRLQKLTGQLRSKSNARTALQKRIGKQQLSAISVNGTFAKITLCFSAKIVHS